MNELAQARDDITKYLVQKIKAENDSRIELAMTSKTPTDEQIFDKIYMRKMVDLNSKSNESNSIKELVKQIHDETNAELQSYKHYVMAQDPEKHTIVRIFKNAIEKFNINFTDFFKAKDAIFLKKFLGDNNFVKVQAALNGYYIENLLQN